MTWKDPATGVERSGIAKVGYSHKAMADIILAKPWITQTELALHFKVTQGWISQIIASDAFQAFVAERKDEIVDPLLRGAIEESMKGLVVQSMMKLREKLEANPSDQFVLEAFKSSTRALGYGARVEVSGNISHTHGLLGVLAGLPPAGHMEKVVNEIEAPAPA